MKKISSLFLLIVINTAHAFADSTYCLTFYVKDESRGGGLSSKLILKPDDSIVEELQQALQDKLSGLNLDGISRIYSNFETDFAMSNNGGLKIYVDYNTRFDEKGLVQAATSIKTKGGFVLNVNRFYSVSAWESEGITARELYKADNEHAIFSLDNESSQSRQ